MQTEVGLFIFHVNLPGGCLLLCQFPHLFCTIFFLGYTFGSLVKRAMHQPPMHFLQNAFKHYIFLSRCFLDINYINLLQREICSGVICQLFNKKKKWRCLAIRQHFSNCIFCILQIQGSQTMGKQNLCLVQIRMLLYQVCLFFFLSFQLTCLILVRFRLALMSSSFSPISF